MARGRKILEHQKERPTCSHCECRPCRKINKNIAGIQLYGKFCEKCHKIIYNLKIRKTDRRAGYRRYKKASCDYCGFVALDPCQLDVDHIDGNRHNNDPNNLQTLCSNCHRLKTKKSREGIFS